MSKNNATYLSLIFVLLLGLFFFVESSTLLKSNDDSAPGAGYFPFWLTIILFILCIVSFLKTLLFEKKNRDVKITIPNLKLVLYTILIIVIFYITWTYFGYLYLLSFLFLMGLLTLYCNSNRWSLKNIFLNLSISGGYTFAVYMLFNVILKLQL